MLVESSGATHQPVFLQDENAGGFVKRSGGESPAVAAPGHRVDFSGVSRELSALAVIFEALLHVLVVLRRHLECLRNNSAAGGKQR